MHYFKSTPGHHSFISSLTAEQWSELRQNVFLILQHVKNGKKCKISSYEMVFYMSFFLISLISLVLSSIHIKMKPVKSDDTGNGGMSWVYMQRF